MTDRHPTDRHPGEEVLLDLALSDLDDNLRDEVTLHLTGCEPCRAEYAAIADAVDRVLLAAPRVDPPAGFSLSVLAGMGIGGGARSVMATPPRRWAWAHRSRHALVAVAAAVGLLVGAGGTAVVLGTRTDTQDQVLASGAPLLTGAGTSVGAVREGRHNGQPVLIVTVADGEPGAYYECRLVLADGTSRQVGSWPLDPDGGGTWVITRPQDAQVAGIEMVTDTGEQWATATL